MTEPDDAVEMKPKNIYHYKQELENLRRELDRHATNEDDVIELLGSIARLQNIQRFSDIGQEADEWAKQTRQNKKVRTGLFSMAISTDEQKELIETVRNWIYEFERVVNELMLITPDSDLSTDKLSHGPRAFLDVELNERYESEIRDLDEACSNLLSGTYTSAELMSLRATEGFLRMWYQKVEGENAKHNITWSNAFAAIDDSAERDEFEGFNLLDVIRERRNELAHPDKHSTRRRANTTLMQTFDLVEQMVEMIEN